jgi:hypothetical protein
MDDSQMTRLTIPVPPAAILEQAVGYRNERQARFLALWWEPCGDEAMVSDGFITFTGHWPGYLAYVQHKTVHPHLAAYNLGSSEEPADHRLVIDLQERQAWIAPARAVERLLMAQWQKEPVPVVSLSPAPVDLEKWIEGLIEKNPVPSMADLMRRMNEDRQHVALLQRWLDGQIE